MRATCGSVWLFRGKDGVMEARSARLPADIYTSNGHGGDELACAEQSTSSPFSRLHVPVLLQSTQPLDWTSVWLYSIPTVLCFPDSMRPVRARSCKSRPHPFPGRMLYTATATKHGFIVLLLQYLSVYYCMYTFVVLSLVSSVPSSVICW